MSLHRLCPLFLAIGVLFGWANACRAEETAFCATKEAIPVDIPFPDMPVSIGEHRIESRIDTTGLMDVANEASMGIEEVDIQIEYTGPGQELIGIIHFGLATAWRYSQDYPPPPEHIYFKSLKKSLAPGESVTLIGWSLRVFTLCPAKARLTAIRVRFSDGTQFLRTVSPWIFQEIQDRMPESHFRIGSVPAQNSVYLVQLTISATGEVQEVQQLKSGPAILPAVVIDELRKWRLPPRTRDGEPEASKILAVLRIMREGAGCDIYCQIPLARADLSPAFVLIDLVHTSITALARPGFERFEVRFGGMDTGNVW